MVSWWRQAPIQILIEVCVCKFAIAELLNSRISIVVNEYQCAYVFNKTFGTVKILSQIDRGGLGPALL